MNYELAKELKEAGFPQTTPFKLFCNKCGANWKYNKGIKHLVHKCKKVNSEADVVHIPTLSELIDACGTKFSNIALVTRKYIGNDNYEELGKLWVCGWTTNGCNDLEDEWEFEGQTPEEAVANLWLALNKK